MTAATRPNAWQYVMYCYGATLPSSMREWVRNDLVGPGAARRTVIRNTIPVLLILAPMLAFPTDDPIVLATMTLPILIPFIYFSIVFNSFYRKLRLKRHGLDPDLVDQARKARDADLHAEYEARHGRTLSR